MDTPISPIQPGDGSRSGTRYPKWGDIVPLPPESLVWSVGGASLELFLVLGDAWAQLISRYIRPGCTVLDIGCGCGRAARLLITNPHVSAYVGFDVIQENVEWCTNFLGTAGRARCRFHHYDLYSSAYNPTGAVSASSLEFPCESGSVGVCFAVSVYTHLLEPDAIHYLEESARVLAPDGTAIFSIHNAVPPGERFVGNEGRIDIATDYFVQLAAAAGLFERDRLDDLGGQQVLIFGKQPRT